MKILDGISQYDVNEANFEPLRLALNYLGENLPAPYFHGIAGTVFRIGGICPCAPTCTLAIQPQQLINLFGYEYEKIPYDDADKDDSLRRLTDAVRGSIDEGVPSLVWNAFTMCEWNLAAGYDENEQVFLGRGPYMGSAGDYAKSPWDHSLEEAGLTGLTALIIKRKTGEFDKRKAEKAAIKEAVRHAIDRENTDKLGDSKWVFMQGKAAYQRWADDFSKPEYVRSLGDAYCQGIYSSCHALAGHFLRGIAQSYPEVQGILTEAAQLFDQEAGRLEMLSPLISWNSPEKDDRRNEKAAMLLNEAASFYGSAIDLLSTAADRIK